MTRYLIRKYLDGTHQNGRKRVGIILGAVGIFFDLLLFVTKHIAGVLSGSVAITADAYNNLTDAGAHITALLAFPLGDKKPSKRFPFGCGRLEYLSGLIIAAAILIVAVRMAASSVDKIIHPSGVENSTTVILILVFSIAVKAYMYRYNKRIGEKIDSAGLRSVATDSACDCFATAAIILSVIIQTTTGWHIDGWTGLSAAGCIFYAGVSSAKESVEQLLGKAIDDKTLDQLYEILTQFPQIGSVNEIAVHDYGPNRRLLTMRLAGDLTGEDLTELKQRISKTLGMTAVIEIERD